MPVPGVNAPNFSFHLGYAGDHTGPDAAKLQHNIVFRGVAIANDLLVARPRRQGRAPGSGVRAVSKWPAEATAKSLAEAGHLLTAVVIADLR